MTKRLQKIIFVLQYFAWFNSNAQFNIPQFGKQNVVGGYEKNIEGEILPYFSSYQQFASEALLTRCTDGNKIITWQSAAIPENFNQEYCYFYCLAGHSTGTSTADRHFDLYINNQFYLTITTPQKRKPPFQWTFYGTDSVAVSFDAQQLDIHTDVFGDLFIRIPKKLITPGKPMTFSLKGKNETSNDWFMIFRYQYEEKIVVMPSPLLVQTTTGIKQIVRIKVDHTFPTMDSLKIKFPSSAYKLTIHPGYNYEELMVDTFSKKLEVNLIAEVGDKFKTTIPFIMSPVHRMEIDIIHHSHNDIGYSNFQEEVAKTQNQNIRKALQLIEQTKDYPTGSKFVWNIESLWAVDNFLQEATADEKKNFFNAVRNNSIALSGHYANLMTGLCKPEELSWMLEYGVELRKKNNLKMNSVMLTDVPGVSWSEVQALADNGYKYFSNGPNYIPSFADGGERIGRTLRDLGDKPFYWQSENGKSKILFWTTSKGYSFFHGIPYQDLDEKRKDKIVEYLNELNGKDYPYATVQMRYSIKSDNGPTDSTLCDFVKKWNEKYLSPKLLIANVNTMMENFEIRYAKQLPVLSGDFTPYWEDGAYSTAKEEGDTRVLSEKIIQLQKLYAMMPAKNLDTNLFYRARRSVVMFHEHTWGSWNSISDPDIPFTTKQWDYKKAFCDSAAYYVQQIEKALLSKKNDFKSLLILNTLSWKRDGYIEFDKPTQFNDIVVMDDQSKPVVLQQLKSGRYCFVAKNIPPKGSRLYKISKGKTDSVDVAGLQYDYGISINRRRGVVNSLQFNSTQWCDTTVFNGLCQTLYIKGLDPNLFFTGKTKKIEMIDNGPVMSCYQFTTSLEGCNLVTYTVTHATGLNSFLFSVVFDKKAVREKESMHIVFPFNLKNVSTRIGVGDTLITPEHGQLTAGNKDFYSVQRWLDVSDLNQGVTISSPQCALFEVDSMVDERLNVNGQRQWRTKVNSSATIFAYILNNYWGTNFKADQEGEIRFDFNLNFHKEFSKEEALKFGWEANEPLIVIEK